MKNIDKTLRLITVLYVIFLALFILEIVVDGVPSFMEGLNDAKATRSVAENGGFHWAYGVIAIPMTGIMIWWIIEFVKLLVYTTISVFRKDIFNDKLILTLTRFSILFAVVMISIFVLHYFVNNFENVTSRSASSYIELMMQIVILLILGQVLRIGKRFKDENDLTV